MKHPFHRIPHYARAQNTNRVDKLHTPYWQICRSPRLPLVIKGSCRRRRLRGSERCGFAERYPVVRQNVHLLIPSGFASLTHRLAAARSRRGSDSPPGCHSTPRRRFATLVTKGRLWCIRFRRWRVRVHRCVLPGGQRRPPLRVRTALHWCARIRNVVRRGRGRTSPLRSGGKFTVTADY